MFNARKYIFFYGLIILISTEISTIIHCAAACTLTKPIVEPLCALPKTKDEEALVRACNTGLLIGRQDNREITRLLIKGTNPNVGVDTKTPAILSCIAHGNSAAVSMFIKHGSKLNANILIHACQDYRLLFQENITKLAIDDITLASLENQVVILAIILQKLKTANVDVNARDPETQSTALMHAAQHHGDLVVPLLEYGANPLLQDINGKTALMYCAESGARIRAEGSEASHEYPIARLLVDAGANITTMDLQGRTVLMYSTDPRSRCLFARHQEYPHIMKLIDRSGLNLPPLITLVMAYLKHDHEDMAHFPQLSPVPLAPKKAPAKKGTTRNSLQYLISCCTSGFP